MKRKQQDTHHRHLSAPLLWILGGFLTLVLGFFLFCYQLTGNIHYVSAADAPTLSQEELDALLKEAAVQDKASVQLCPLGNTQQKTTHILLIGQDRREGEPRARADAMILCTLLKDTSKLIMTSFLRDLYVQIPGYRNNRLNAAYAAGGMPLLKRTFQENFGIVIDGCIEVDFHQFSQLIDQMGGITLELRQDEADLINEAQLGPVLREGLQLLGGEQALAYARIRSLDSDGDFSRTNRQRKIMLALFQRCKSTSLPGVLGYLKAAMPMLTTDIPRTKLLSLARDVLRVLPNMDITGQHIPVDGSFSYEYVDGMSVLMADIPQNRTFLEKQFYAE